MNTDQLIRITRYYRSLNRLKTIGLERVFANNLADAAGVSAAIVRKDFSQLSIYGQKRGGYQIADLLVSLGELLGKGELYHHRLWSHRKGLDALHWIRTRRDSGRCRL